MKLLYFAWVREKIGKGEEEISLPENVATVAELLSWLQGRGEGFAAALERSDIIRVAIDQEHAGLTDDVRHAREIALFPPMTGG